MLEQAILSQQFQALLEKEQQAEKMYGDMLANVSDPEMREQLLQIRREKQRHIQLVQRLLEIVD